LTDRAVAPDGNVTPPGAKLLGERTPPSHPQSAADLSTVLSSAIAAALELSQLLAADAAYVAKFEELKARTEELEAMTEP
jgi:hypothetical protein